MMSLSNAIDPESSSHTKLDEVEIKYGLLQVFAQLYNFFLPLHQYYTREQLLKIKYDVLLSLSVV